MMQRSAPGGWGWGWGWDTDRPSVVYPVCLYVRLSVTSAASDAGDWISCGPKMTHIDSVLGGVEAGGGRTNAPELNKVKHSLLTGRKHYLSNITRVVKTLKYSASLHISRF